MVSRIPKYVLWAICLGILFSGCQSLDNDSAYEISTKASFFLVSEPGATLSIYKYKDHALTADWNAEAGVSKADLSDFQIMDNEIWIASGPQKSLLRVSPSSASVKETFSALPLSPHFIAVGESQIMAVDTGSGQIALIKRKNGKAQLLEFEGRPGRCLYNSGKFYLAKDSNLVAIYDEKAMTLRAEIDLGMAVDEILLDKYHVITVMVHDSTAHFQGLIDANGDFLVHGLSSPVNYSVLRPTPYFAVRFGNEFLKDLRLVGNTIVTNDNQLIATGATNFEADFFESTIFYALDDHLVVKNMATDSLLDSLPFQGRLLKSVHQYADE